MEKVARYRQFIQQLLSRYAEHRPSSSEIDVQAVFDTVRDHYQIVHVGWRQSGWVHSCTVHLDIKDGKIWIQWNGTEDDLAAELVEMGVPKKDIVIGFHAPYMRQFTDFAVG